MGEVIHLDDARHRRANTVRSERIRAALDRLRDVELAADAVFAARRAFAEKPDWQNRLWLRRAEAAFEAFLGGGGDDAA